MTTAFIYFLKVNGALALFYAFYRVFFYRDTFFQLRRALLLAFIGLAGTYPLLSLEGWIGAQPPMAELANSYAMLLPTLHVQPDTAATEGTGWLLKAARYLYGGGVVLLSIRFIMQLGSILRLARQSKRTRMGDTWIYLLSKPCGPFSFFQMIFLHLDKQTEEEIKEILTHEKTHASQWHSIDVILYELLTMLCWGNPFVWLLKRELRYNLEYLADQHVIRSGHDSKSYQYHLLGLTYQQAAATLYNNLNVLLLKNRIRMMNQERTRTVGIIKYVMLLPLVATLILLSNIEALARTSAQQNTSQNDASAVTRQDDPDKIHRAPDVMPQYPGGMTKLLQFLGENIKYPQDAQKTKTEGRVVCQFVVEKDGSINDVKVLRKISPSLDNEAVRVIQSMPKWEPGTVKGEPVRCMYTIPISFSLQKKDK